MPGDDGPDEPGEVGHRQLVRGRPDDVGGRPPARAEHHGDVVRPDAGGLCERGGGRSGSVTAAVGLGRSTMRCARRPLAAGRRLEYNSVRRATARQRQPITNPRPCRRPGLVSDRRGRPRRPRRRTAAPTRSRSGRPARSAAPRVRRRRRQHPQPPSVARRPVGRSAVALVLRASAAVGPGHATSPPPRTVARAIVSSSLPSGLTKLTDRLVAALGPVLRHLRGEAEVVGVRPQRCGIRRHRHGGQRRLPRDGPGRPPTPPRARRAPRRPAA